LPPEKNPNGITPDPMNAPYTAPSSKPTIDSACLLALTIRYAGAHYAREDWLAARDFLSVAAEIDPNYPRLLGSLGSLQFQLQEYPAACTTFSAAVRQNPNDPDLHIQLAMVQLKLDHPEAAEASLNSALGLRPNDLTALKLLADSKRDHGRYLEAGAIYGKLINQHPDQVGVFLSLAKCFYKVGDREGTQAALQFVLTLDPANEIARENLATLQA
jgi:tetratricopeptide (TPR) repeat protein